MKKYVFALAALALLTTQSVHAQYYDEVHTSDTQLHTGFQMSGKLSDKLVANWGEELYFGNNMGQFQKLYSRVMFSYRLLPNLSISPLVLHIVNIPQEQYTMIYDLNIIYTHRISDLSIILRGGGRMHHNLSLGQTPGIVKNNPEFQARFHLGAKYRIDRHWEPYANIETFLTLNPATNGEHTVGYYLPRVRSNVGVRFCLDEHNAISFYWRYDYTKSKHLSYELMDTSYGIITKTNTNNFLGIFYDYTF